MFQRASAQIQAGGARVDLRNARNRTAIDLAHELQAPPFLLQALEGHTATCERIVANGSTGLVTYSF